MERFKEWWLMITVITVIIACFFSAKIYSRKFEQEADSGFLGWSYKVSIPKKYMNEVLAQKYHDTFLRFIDTQIEASIRRRGQ